jgi:hypothetical protein
LTRIEDNVGSGAEFCLVGDFKAGFNGTESLLDAFDGLALKFAPIPPFKGGFIPVPAPLRELILLCPLPSFASLKVELPGDS